MQDMTFACGNFPTSGQTVMARLSIGQGGKGSNQAIACGRLGISTLYIGASGQDPFATKVRTFYRHEGIGCHLSAKSGESTGTAVILVNRNGENEIIIEPGANARLAPKDIPVSALRSARVVVTQLEANLRATEHALRAGRRYCATTVLNPAPMRADFNTELLRFVDVLIPNETEFVALVRILPGLRRRNFTEQKLSKLADVSLHALCRQVGVPTVIVTLGRRGCFVSDEASWTRVPAYSGMKVIDTTGAGDAFCGGFAAGLVRTGGDIVAAAKLGTAVAALSITKPGAAGSMPTRAELDRFLRQRSNR